MNFRQVLPGMLGIVLAIAMAAKAEDPGPRGIDDQLLDELMDVPTDPSGPNKPSGAQSSLDRALMQELGVEDLGAEKEDPLLQLAERMKQSQQRMGNRDTSPETQEIQKDISNRLASLIEEAQKQGKSQGGQSSPASGKPASQGDAKGSSPKPGSANESTKRVDQADPVERDATDNVKDTIRRVWGHLPDKMREQMQNSLDDQFLPKYENLIEQYYQRLAEEPSLGP